MGRPALGIGGAVRLYPRSGYYDVRLASRRRNAVAGSNR